MSNQASIKQYVFYKLLFLQTNQKIQKKYNYIGMDLFSFMKQKSVGNGNSYTNKGQKKGDKKVSTKVMRMDTQTNHMLSKKNKTQTKVNYHHEQQLEGEKTEKIQRYAAQINRNQSNSTINKKNKTNMKIKQILSTLSQIKYRIEFQYEQLLNNNMSKDNYKQVLSLLSTHYFRYTNINYYKVLDEFCNVISALQLLISKLTNNQKLPEVIMIRDQEDFVLFFKLFFSKPYHLINMPPVRKIIKLLWDKMSFDSLTLPATINNLRLWIFGIATPVNPSMNKLHQYVIDKFEDISRLVNHKSNHYVYIGVNQSDAMGLTPLMVATIAKNTKAMQKLIKNGANIFCCPLTYNMKEVVQIIEESKYGKKTMYRKQYGIRQRKQADVLQILRNQNRIDQLGQILCWKSFYEKKKMKTNKQLSDYLFSFPNCSFQIDWKQYKGMLCFKELPQDIITIYKKDYFLRIDFHIKDLQTYNKKQKDHYSIILKCQPKKQNKLYLIAHSKKQIINILQDKTINSIKEQFNTILKYGSIYNSQINQIKAIYIPQENRLTASAVFYYQNVVKFPLQKFQSLKEYLQAVMNSEIVNYKQIEKNQLAAVIHQKISFGQKVKRKIIEENATVDVQWIDEILNISHLELIFKVANLVFPSSLTLNKIFNLVQIFKDPLFHQKQLKKRLPLRCKYSFNSELNIQSEIKNIKYNNLDESVFNIQIKAKQQKYEQIQEKVNLSHLQDTVFIDESYSINASRFIGQSQKYFEIQQQEANRKFDMLLKLQGIWSDEQQEQK